MSFREVTVVFDVYSFDASAGFIANVYIELEEDDVYDGDSVVAEAKEKLSWLPGNVDISYINHETSW